MVSDWINKLMYPSGNWGLTVNLFLSLAPIAGVLGVQESRTWTGGHDPFWFCGIKSWKIFQIFLCLKFFGPENFHVQNFWTTVFSKVKFFCRKFLRVKLSKPEKFWLMQFFYGKIFWAHTCIFVWDSVVSVTFFHDRMRKFLCSKFYEMYFFYQWKFLNQIFLHIKINLQFFFSAKLFCRKFLRLNIFKIFCCIERKKFKLYFAFLPSGLIYRWYPGWCAFTNLRHLDRPANRLPMYVDSWFRVWQGTGNDVYWLPIPPCDPIISWFQVMPDVGGWFL